ncbi:gamma-tubulin complex component 6-like isoform X1 [Sitodiplosis mosellana]|uniref:gamma-tubulin complex component 6-like isoform X1 n=1 Tax=Sitodiplosis mosellana TaxID=263140 RepID=UPI002443DA45|nr:gamma-tubulin complex component 6-like isoform X1 [Sitodiplosis mosellana]
MDQSKMSLQQQSDQVSIQLLLDDLCKSIYKDVNASKDVIAHSLYRPSGHQKNDTIPEELLKKCRKKAFETLLRKSNVKSLSASRSSIDEGYSEIIDPVRELQYSQFEYSIFVGEMRPNFGPYGFIKERQEKKILKKLELFKECVQFVDGNDYFCNEQNDGYSILWFLTLLKNKSNMDTLLAAESYFSLALNQMPSFPVIQVKYFKLNWEPNVELEHNPYCQAMRKLSRRSKLFHLPGLAGLVDQSSRQTSTQIQPNIVQEVLDSVRNRIRPSNIYYEANKWEHQGLRIALNKDTDPELIASLYEKKFCTELPDTALNLMAIAAERHQQQFQAHIIDSKRFNEHIKLLLIGIESESFVYDPSSMTFRLVEHLTVENILPDTIAHFVLDFIECGACYKRLKSLISTNNFQLKYNGFVFKTLCSSLDRYLETFRSAIIVDRNETICELLVRVSPLIKQVRILAKLLAVHPSDADRDLSSLAYGSEFLGYLYNQITEVTQQDVYALLVFILSQCCAVYFRRFSNWIYHGTIEDPGQELFIEFNNYYVAKTKSFFDKAFIIKISSVPGFLRGWENSILLCGKYSNLLKVYNPTHPLFSIIPPQLTVCLSFAQIRAVEAECQKYQVLAQAACGRPFQLDNLFKRRQEKRLELVKVIAERTKLNLEQWKAEQEVKAAKKQEKHEKNRLELMQQIEEIRAQKLRKRREEVEADLEYLRQSELVELELIERENEQRRKNIEYYNELAQIVDAQQKRTDTEIRELKSKLSHKTNRNESNEDIENTLVNIDHAEAESDQSDAESVYFDADKSTSSTSSKAFQSPDMLKSPDTAQTPEILQAAAASISRSASDHINSNVIDMLSQDRARNRANVLKSNINLIATEEVTQKVDIPNGPLTDAQKNKLKMLHQEYGLIDANANTEVMMRDTAPAELTELQKNRNKVLASEFGITDVVVNVSTENRCNAAFNRNKKLAQENSHTFGKLDEVNANKPMTDLQLNRQKVLMQEYGMNSIETRTTAEATTLRNKLKASLSLDLDNTKMTQPNLLSPKACQSDFVVSPMSTTSDELIASSLNEAGNDKSPPKVRLDCSIAKEKEVNFDQFTADIEERPTPMSALNTAGIERHNGGFEFNVPYKSQPTFSQILRPSSGSSSIFDISSRLSATRSNKATPPSPINQSSKSLSKSELQDLSSGNLAYFLEQSFTIPLQVFSNILNNEILKIFFHDLDVLSHFQDLRNYFFMMDGEFASNVCDGLLNKLQVVRKPSELLNSYTLHSILESALQSSVGGINKNAENLSFCIPSIPEQFDMTSPNVLSELHLSYKVEWPLNLLLSNEAVEHYDKVFQHLLKLRRITWLLDECLYKLKDIRKQSAENIQTSSQFRHVQQIRHKLLCFVDALQNHIISIAIEGSWLKFQTDLKTVKSMEDLYKKHTKYLKRVKFLCMLNRSSHEFYVKVEDIFVVILRFCNKLQSKNWKCDNGVYSHPNYDKLIQIEEDFTKLIKYIIYAGNKMSQCGYQAEIGEFIYMININGFYD